MSISEFIRFHKVKRDDMTREQAIEYLEISPAHFNELRKLELLTPVDGGSRGGRKLFFLRKEVEELWDKILEFNLKH